MQSDRARCPERALALGQGHHPRHGHDTVSKANTKIEDTPVRTIIMGEVYLERKETGKSQQLLCLIGEKGKVLLTFFTAR